ncbi:MAG: flagellar basal body P-ring formation chaperone FlgA [Oligoflexia bacterium]|nr:flagellar basal body P-ring formation chaperone FlgA [Oligoflexia bacterium]
MRQISLILLVLALTGSAAYAGGQKVRVVGRDESTVTTDAIRLSDIADVYPMEDGNDEAVIGLKRLLLASSPAPGEVSTITAAQTLERMRTQGIRLEQIGYALPRLMRVKRAARPLNEDEIRNALLQFLSSRTRDVTLKALYLKEHPQVAPGDVSFDVRPFDTGRSARQGFNVTARVAGAPEVRFDLEADVDEWREVPVASRSISRGSKIETGDIMMARLNLGTLARDAALDENQILGKEINHDLDYGEAFTHSKLVIPPIIQAGSKVTVIYRSKLFEASATGTAMEAGMPGQNIRVRNDSSKKIVTGTALEPGLVEIRP